MENSSLVDCVVMSPNHSGKRTHAVDRITPHCVVGQATAERIGKCFPAGRDASCNYGIGKDGRVCLIVDEDNRSWCSSSPSNDQRAITIECASDETPPYAFNDAVYDKLIKLCVDICKRYNKTKLIWIENKKEALSYQPKENEMQLTVHRWFANKDCPGDWMYERMGDLAMKVTNQLTVQTIPPVKTNIENKKQEEKVKYPAIPFLVKVLVPNLNIKKRPNGDITGKVAGMGTQSIIKVLGDWGLLESGEGYILLSNPDYVKILCHVPKNISSSYTIKSIKTKPQTVNLTAQLPQESWIRSLINRFKK